MAVRPFRAVDTRLKGGPVAAGKVLAVAIGGHGGVPASNVAAVAITLTAVTPDAVGGLVAYAHGLARHPDEEPALRRRHVTRRRP